MLSLSESLAVYNFPFKLSPSAVQKYYPRDCLTCLASKLARRLTVPADPSIFLLPGKNFEVDKYSPYLLIRFRSLRWMHMLISHMLVFLQTDLRS